MFLVTFSFTYKGITEHGLTAEAKVPTLISEVVDLVLENEGVLDFERCVEVSTGDDVTDVIEGALEDYNYQQAA